MSEATTPDSSTRPRLPSKSIYTYYDKDDTEQRQNDELFLDLEKHVSYLQGESKKFQEMVTSGWDKLKKEREQLEKDKTEFATLTQKLQKVQVPNKIILNIGGHYFTTSHSTLTTDPPIDEDLSLSKSQSLGNTKTDLQPFLPRKSFFSVMFSGSWNLTPDPKDGSYFVDRDGTHFRYILNFLRTGKLIIPNDETLFRELLEEAEFYQIEGLINKLRELQPQEFFVSTTLLNQGQQKKLNDWTNTPKQQWILLYRGSRDGFTADSFHKLCDNKGETYVVMKSHNGFLFGGYVPISWSSRGGYVWDNRTFIFTLTNPNYIPPTKYTNTGPSHSNRYSFYDNGSFGPTFGGGYDIYVSPDHGSLISYFNFPHSFQDTTGYKSNTFTGASSFHLAEIEVFARKIDE